MFTSVNSLKILQSKLGNLSQGLFLCLVCVIKCLIMIISKVFAAYLASCLDAK